MAVLVSYEKKIPYILARLIRKKIIIVIGDISSHIYYLESGFIKDQLKLNDGFVAEEAASYSDFIAKYPKIAVFLLLDLAEQSLHYDKSPTLKNTIFHKLVSKKISKEYPNGELVNYYQIHKNKEKNQLTYVIADIASNNRVLNSWLAFLRSKSRLIWGIFSLPLEIAHLSRELEYVCKQETTKKLLKFAKSKHNYQLSAWKMLVVQTDDAGLRIIAMQNNLPVFSRLLSFLPGQIEKLSKLEPIQKEILDSLEYLKRLALKEKIDVYFMLKPELASRLESDFENLLRAKFVNLQQLSTYYWGMKKAAWPAKNFTDLFVSLFSSSGRFFVFPLRKIQSDLSRFLYNYVLNKIFIILFVSIGLMLSFKLKELNYLNMKIEEYQQQSISYKESLQDYREDLLSKDVDEENILNISKLDKDLSGKEQQVILLINHLASIRPQELVIQKISYLRKNTEKIKISAYLLQGDLSVRELFSIYDVFIQRLKEEFPQYQILYSELADNFSSEERMQVEIELLLANE